MRLPRQALTVCRRLAAPLALAAAVALALPASRWTPVAHAADWGGIEPGASTQASVRSRWGAPTRQTRGTLEGFAVSTWTWEGQAAPAGMVRLTVEFGLKTPGGFKADLVRTLKLEPKPGVFSRATLIEGWGFDGVESGPGEAPALYFPEGLLVVLDAARQEARELIFALPRPVETPRR